MPTLRTENFLNEILASKPAKLNELAKKPMTKVVAPDSPPQLAIKSLKIKPNDPRLPQAQD